MSKRSKKKPSRRRVTLRDRLAPIAARLPRRLLALVFLLVLAYPNVVFFGDSLVASANYPVFDDRFNHLGYEPVLHTPFMNWHDLGATWWQWEPGGQFFSRNFRAGRMPLWDPTTAGGTDAHTNITQGQYFPPYALLLLLGNSPLMRDAYYLALLLASGYFCVRLLERVGFHRYSALSMGAMWMLGGSLTLTVNSLLGQTYAMIPAAVLAAHWFLERPNPKRGAVLALGIAALVLASFMPAAISGLLLVGLLSLVMIVPARWFEREVHANAGTPFLTLTRFALFFALGMAAAAFLLLPLQLAGQSSDRFSAWYTGTGLHHYSIDRLITLVSPWIAFDVWQIQDPAKHLLPGDTMNFAWAGITPLLLIVLAPVRMDARRGRLLLFFALAAVVTTLKLIGVPPFQWLAYLPVLKKIHFIPYFNGALNLAIAGVAAFGIENVIRERPSTRRIAAVAAAFALIVIGYGVVLSRHEVNPGFHELRMAAEGAKLFLAAAALLTILILRRRRLSGPRAGLLILCVISFELVPQVLHDRLNRFDPWVNPPHYVSFLQKDHSLSRVHSIEGQAMTPNVPQGLGLSALGSRHTFNAARMDRFLRTFFKTAELPYPLPQSLIPEPRAILDLLNVKYVVLRAATPEEAASVEVEGFDTAFTDWHYQVLRNRDVWPRAWMATKVTRVAGEDAALKAVRTIDRWEVVLEEGAGTGPQHLSGGRTQVLRYTPDEVIIRTESRGPGLLFLADSHAPGWKAMVNGVETKILPANHAFRAVAVPAGGATVVFRYRTPGFGAGLLISFEAVLIILAALLIGLRRDRRELPSEG